MSNIVPFMTDEICDNCGNRGALDFMGDCFCPSCLKICKRCMNLFVIDLKQPKGKQEYCSECEREAVGK